MTFCKVSNTSQKPFGRKKTSSSPKECWLWLCITSGRWRDVELGIWCWLSFESSEVWGFESSVCLPVFVYLLPCLTDDTGNDIDIIILPKIVVFILVTAYVSLLSSQVYLDSCLYRYILYISSVFPFRFSSISATMEVTCTRHVAVTECSYAAILADGGLVTWGSSHFGGDSREIQEPCCCFFVGSLSRPNILDVKSRNPFNIVFEKHVLFFGKSILAHDPRGCTAPHGATFRKDQIRKVVAIKSSCCGFAALQEDGSVISWGHPAMPKDMANQLADPNHPIIAIQSSSHAFAALGKDGSVKTWGNRDYGGETWIWIICWHILWPQKTFFFFLFCL